MQKQRLSKRERNLPYYLEQVANLSELRNLMRHYCLCERAKQVMWRTMKLLLGSQEFQEKEWERVFRKSSHATTSLLFNSTNHTFHERLMLFLLSAVSDSNTYRQFWWEVTNSFTICDTVL